jgi:hypothetical protein
MVRPWEKMFLGEDGSRDDLGSRRRWSLEGWVGEIFFVFGGLNVRLGFDGQAEKIDEWTLGVGGVQPGSINLGRFCKQWGLCSQGL